MRSQIIEIVTSTLLLLPSFTWADVLLRFECQCAASTVWGWHLEYQYQTARVPGKTFDVEDKCVSVGDPRKCPDIQTVLVPYKSTIDGHTFVYHRNVFSADKYEFDGSGKKSVPVKQAHNQDGVKE